MKTQTEIAKEIATMAHKGQTRTLGPDQGKPYIIHPERVAQALKHTESDFLQAAGWLHDVLEDTYMTEEMLQYEGIDPFVISIIKTVTKLPGENYLDFILRVKRNDNAIPVKIVDIQDNMISLEECSLKDKYRLALHILRSK